MLERVAASDDRVGEGRRSVLRSHPIYQLSAVHLKLARAIILSCWIFAELCEVSSRAIVPFSMRISQITPQGLKSASRARSTAASYALGAPVPVCSGTWWIKTVAAPRRRTYTCTLRSKQRPPLASFQRSILGVLEGSG